MLLLFQVSFINNKKTNFLNLFNPQAKKKKIEHIETRNVSTGLELYLEIISYSLSEWTAVRNILETLNSIDIHPRETSTHNGKIGQGKSNHYIDSNCFLL